MTFVLRVGLLTASLLIGASAFAADSVDVSRRFATIHAESQSAMRNAKGNIERQLIAQQRASQLTTLLDEAIKAKSKDVALLAGIAIELGRYSEARRFAQAAVDENSSDEGAWYSLVQSQARRDQTAAATETLEEALKRFPESPQIRTLRSELIESWSRQREPGKAADQLREMLRDGWPTMIANPEQADSYLQDIDRLISFDRSAKQYDAALKSVTELLGNARSAYASGKKELLSLADGLLERQLRLLADAGRSNEALDTLNDHLQRVDNRIADTNNSLHYVRRKSSLLQVKLDIYTLLGDTAAAERTRTAMVEFVDDQLSKSPSIPLIVDAWFSVHQRVIADHVRDHQFDRAERELNDMRVKFDQLRRSQPELVDTYERGRAALTFVNRRLQQERLRGELIGQSAPPLPADTAWAYNPTANPPSLMGKVVLIDFFAVWSEPSVSILPELKRWQEKYGPQGLAIIGVTHSGNVEVDAETGQPQSRNKLSPADAQAAIANFGKFHQLPFPVAQVEDREFFKQWRVAGIPQFGVVDRQGIIQLIRVGSGKPNLQAVEAAIARILNEKPEKSTP